VASPAALRAEASPDEAPFLALVTAVLPLEGSTERELAFVAQFSTTGLVAEDGGIQGELRIRVTDARGKEVRSVGEPFVLPATTSYGAPLAGLKLFGELPLAPGRYAFDLKLIGPTGRQVAAARPSVEVPQADVNSWVASPPLVADGRPGWSAFRANSLQASGLPFPFIRLDGSDFLPRADVVLPSGHGAELLLLIKEGVGGFPALRAELAPQSGEGAGTDVPIELESVAPSQIEGMVVASVRVDLPARVGPTQLRVGFVNSPASMTAAAPLALELVAESATPSTATAPSAITPDAMAVISPGSLAAGYMDVLRQFATDGTEAAATKLAEFEQAVTASDRGSRLRDLRDAEEEAAKQVAARDPEAWIAILALHVAADEAFVGLRDPWLVAQGRRFAGRLVKIARMAREPGSRAFAADALSLLMPNEALEIDPRHRLAMLRVAISLERGFRYAEAVDLLRRMVAAHPDDMQGHLRLGVNLRRIGQIEDARRELSNVLSSNAPSWMRELACGELAGLEHDGGRRDVAEKILSDGIEKLQAEQLYLQLAFYLEERNRSREAVQLVNQMPVEEGQERASARHVYAQDPQAEIGRVRERLFARADQARARLASALAQPAVGGGS